MRGVRIMHTWSRLALAVCGLIFIWFQIRNWRNDDFVQKSIVYDSNNVRHEYDKNHPFIFIGGHPRSGTTLMRALLDAHPYVRCGEETRIIPRIVQMKESWYKNDNEVLRLQQAGIVDEVVDSAISSFIMETIVRHGEPAKVLCNKDPLTLKSGAYMAHLFPKSKWLFMVRDGRAVIHSVMTRKVTITGYDLNDARQCLKRWNSVVENMKKQCDTVGPLRCMIVYYEQLVLHPRRWMEMILSFLDIPWDESVMHHQDFINQKGEKGIRVSMKERSSDQIVKPINVEALTQWVGHFPADVVEEMPDIVPMLKTFGYDPEENPPNYGVPDGFVINNTKEILENKDFWEVRSKQLVAMMNKKSP